MRQSANHLAPRGSVPQLHQRRRRTHGRGCWYSAVAAAARMPVRSPRGRVTATRTVSCRCRRAHRASRRSCWAGVDCRGSGGERLERGARRSRQRRLPKRASVAIRASREDFKKGLCCYCRDPASTTMWCPHRLHFLIFSIDLSDCVVAIRVSMSARSRASSSGSTRPLSPPPLPPHPPPPLLAHHLLPDPLCLRFHRQSTARRPTRASTTRVRPRPRPRSKPTRTGKTASGSSAGPVVTTPTIDLVRTGAKRVCVADQSTRPVSSDVAQTRENGGTHGRIAILTIVWYKSASSPRFTETASGTRRDSLRQYVSGWTSWRCTVRGERSAGEGTGIFGDRDGPAGRDRGRSWSRQTTSGYRRACIVAVRPGSVTI